MRCFLLIALSKHSFGHNFLSPLNTLRSTHSTLSHAFTRRLYPTIQMEETLRKALAEKQSAVDSQGNAVRALKAAKAAKADVDAAIEALNGLKLEKASIEKQLQAAVSGGGGDGSLNREAFRQTVNNTLERRLFYIPSFKIYRGVAGLYDYGPPGCAVKSNVLGFWRQVSSKLKFSLSTLSLF